MISRLKCHDQLECSYSIASLHSFLQQTSLSSPLFTSGEGGPPAAPGPPASRWQKGGSEAPSAAPARDICPFPRYLMASGRCFCGAQILAKHLNLAQKKRFE